MIKKKSPEPHPAHTEIRAEGRAVVTIKVYIVYNRVAKASSKKNYTTLFDAFSLGIIRMMTDSSVLKKKLSSEQKRLLKLLPLFLQKYQTRVERIELLTK